VSAALIAAADRVLTAYAQPRRRIALGIVRAGLAAIIAGLYLQNIPWRRLLWGPDGLVPSSLYAHQLVVEHGPGLYFLSASTWWFELLFWGGLLITVLYAFGVVPLVSGPLCFACTWSLLARDPFVQDAGWNLVRVLLIYLLFADTSAFALADGRIAALAKRIPRTLVAMRGIIHNSALMLILFQLALLYSTSCFYKVTGHKWQDGTALYYVLRTNQFDISAFGSVIWHVGWLAALGTYGTLIFQAAYPFWIWQRPYKYLIAVGAVFFHLSILYTMALPFFSAIMIVSEAMLFGDEEYQRAYAWVRSRLGRGVVLTAAAVDESAPAVPAGG
jgi:hypothetical protein